jgi:hypothetical protein
MNHLIAALDGTQRRLCISDVICIRQVYAMFLEKTCIAGRADEGTNLRPGSPQLRD